ncbi:hypothetical protein ACE6H2_002036 [Prunus campanulata]
MAKHYLESYTHYYECWARNQESHGSPFVRVLTFGVGILFCGILFLVGVIVSLLADIIQPQDLKELCSVLMVVAEKVAKTLADPSILPFSTPRAEHPRGLMSDTLANVTLTVQYPRAERTRELTNDALADVTPTVRHPSCRTSKGNHE